MSLGLLAWGAAWAAPCEVACSAVPAFTGNSGADAAPRSGSRWRCASPASWDPQQRTSSIRPSPRNSDLAGTLPTTRSTLSRAAALAGTIWAAAPPRTSPEASMRRRLASPTPRTRRRKSSVSRNCPPVDRAATIRDASAGPMPRTRSSSAAGAAFASTDTTEAAATFSPSKVATSAMPAAANANSATNALRPRPRAAPRTETPHLPHVMRTSHPLDPPIRGTILRLGSGTEPRQLSPANYAGRYLDMPTRQARSSSSARCGAHDSQRLQPGHCQEYWRALKPQWAHTYRDCR